MASLNFRFKKIDETRNDFLEKIKQDQLISKNHIKVCKALNYFEHFLIFITAVSGCVSVDAFALFFNLCSRIKNLWSHCKN